MTGREPHRITHIGQFAMTSDGSKYAFKVFTADAPEIDLEIETQKLGELVSYIVGQAASLSRQAVLNGAPQSPPGFFSPIPMDGIGLAASNSPGKSLIVVGLYTFRLAFEVPNTKLPELAEQFRYSAMLTAETEHTRGN